MNFVKSRGQLIVLLFAVALSACNIGATPPAQDPGAIQTQAFGLVLTQSAGQLTQTAQAASPTPNVTNTAFAPATFAPPPTFGQVGATPFPFNTQQPGFTAIASPLFTVGPLSTTTTKNGCNDGAYLGETGPADYTEVAIGEVVRKGYSIQNTGTCTWNEGYGFIYMLDLSSPEITLGQSILLPKNHPEQYTAPNHSQTFLVTYKAPKVVGEYKAYWKLRDDLGNFFGPLVFSVINVRKP